MSKKRFTEEEREQLSKNRYVRNVSDEAITYADEFKQLFIDEYIMGQTPREIFEAHGFNFAVIGMKRVEQSADAGRKPTTMEKLLSCLTPEKKPWIKAWGV